MKNDEMDDELPAFDWDEHLKNTLTSNDIYHIERSIPHNSPLDLVADRSRQMGDLLLRTLQLDLSTDDIEVFFESPWLESKLLGIVDDERLFGRTREILTDVIEVWETILPNRPTLTEKEKHVLIERLYELGLIDGCIIDDYSAYLEGLEENQ